MALVKSNVLPKSIDSKGNLIRIGHELGRGGEGTVYSVEGNSGVVLKIYHKYDEERSKKISLMSTIKNDRLLKYTAWPIDVVKNEKGIVIGLLMPVANGKEIHKLYSPKNRLTEFDNVSLPFLVHTAANIARSFAVVHENGQVVGDVNHGNIIVSNDGTVKLIDCDSFQIESQGNRYLCKVGVGTHQPPELQSKSLSNVVRTVNHDNFGLAVIIFQLLFMGRHPFSGRYLHGDMPIEKAIEQYRFAYGKNAKQRDMQQPPGTLPLDFYSNELAELFERAFSQKSANNRPQAIEWIRVLEKLNKEMSVCSLNQAHAYSKTHNVCPWCEYERKTGLALFSIFIKSKLGDSYVFRLDLIWKAIIDINPPHEREIPKLINYTFKPSDEIIKMGKGYKGKKTTKLMISYFLGLFSVFLTLTGSMGIYPLAGVIAAFVIGSRKPNNKQYSELLKGYEQLNQNWNALQNRWNKEASVDKFFAKFKELEEYKSKYEQIPSLRTSKLKQLEKDQKNRQLNEFLDMFYIQSSQINHIGPSRKAVLQSYGIETARDISKQTILNVPGFGPFLTNHLIDWRKEVEKSFVFDPKKGIPKSDVQLLEKEINGLKMDLEVRLSKGEGELKYISTTILNRREELVKEVEECLKQLGESKANIDYLKSVI